MPPVKWTEERILQELEPIVRELGRAPRAGDLAERGLSGLWSAMRRRGGCEQYVEMLSTPASEGAAPATSDAATAEDDTTISEDAIREAAYHRALEHGDSDPVANWLAAERELRAKRG